MEIYFDNSATTRCFESVVDLVGKLMREDYGNPSSMHKKGIQAENYVRAAKRIISENLKVAEKEIVFTSGGTESDNLAIIGTAMANKRAGMHIVTTKVEHSAVLNSMKYLEEQGFCVTYVPVDRYGVVCLDQLEKALTPDTILVSVMHINNEVGAVQPIWEISKLIKEKAKNAAFHVDAVQSYGKYRIYPKKWGISLLSVSGHKIHGPKGTGFLYIEDKLKIKPVLYGGGQQGGIRSGTENVPGTAGLGAAVEEIYKDFEEKVKALYELKRYFTEGLKKLDAVRINGPELEQGAPHIISASFLGIRSEVLLHALEEYEIYISAGSACSSNKPAPSATLSAIGLKKEELETTVRFSFSFDNTLEEAEECLERLQEIVPKLRRFTRR